MVRMNLDTKNTFLLRVNHSYLLKIIKAIEDIFRGGREKEKSFTSTRLMN